jgi:hypothetical protein
MRLAVRVRRRSTTIAAFAAAMSQPDAALCQSSSRTAPARRHAAGAKNKARKW